MALIKPTNVAGWFHACEDGSQRFRQEVEEQFLLVVVEELGSGLGESRKIGAKCSRSAIVTYICEGFMRPDGSSGPKVFKMR